MKQILFRLVNTIIFIGLISSAGFIILAAYISLENPSNNGDIILAGLFSIMIFSISTALSYITYGYLNVLRVFKKTEEHQ